MLSAVQKISSHDISELKALRRRPETALAMREIRSRLLAAIARQGIREDLPDVSIMGSTLFVIAEHMNRDWFRRKLPNAQNAQGLNFPVIGRKAEDLDVREIIPEGRKIKGLPTSSCSTFEELILPCLNNLELECRVRQDDRNPNRWAGFFGRDYSKSELEASFQHAVFKPNLRSEIKGAWVGVEVEIYKPHSLLELLPPQQIFAGYDWGQHSNIRWHDWRVYMSSVVSRSMHHSDFRKSEPTAFQPTDLLNIFNLCHANPKQVDLDDPITCRLIRLMTLSYMAAMSKVPDNFEPEQFTPSVDNIKKYLSALEPSLIEGHDIGDGFAHMILNNFKDVVRKIFPQQPGYTALCLTSAELNYLDRMHGNLSSTPFFRQRFWN